MALTACQMILMCPAGFPSYNPADMSRRHLFTSESVTEGHPDKLADQISDAVLDAIMADDPGGRVACETVVTTGLVIVAGEISTEPAIDLPEEVRRTITDIGYTEDEEGNDAVIVLSHEFWQTRLGGAPGGAAQEQRRAPRRPRGSPGSAVRSRATRRCASSGRGRGRRR